MRIPALMLATVILFGGSLAAQPTPPPISQFPPVDRVKVELKGADPMDTAARHMGAFWQLQQIIKQMTGLRWTNNRLTPEEKRLIGEYSAAYQAAAQPYASYPDRPKWYKMHASYETSDEFREELFRRFLSAGVRGQWAQTEAQTKATVEAGQRAREQAVREEREQAEAAHKEFKAQLGIREPSEEQRGLRRCMEAGLSQPQCISEGIGKSFKDSFLGGIDLPLFSPAKVTGLRMGGTFPKSGATGVDLKFYAEQVVVTCQDLYPHSYEYTVAVRDGQGVITIQLEPRPLVLTVRPDGRLAGPAALDIAGQVQVGTQEGTRTWSDGRIEMISWPVFAPRTRRCGAVLLTSSGPSPEPATMTDAGAVIAGLITGAGGHKPPKPLEPGLQLSGEYGTQADFDLEFRAEGVIVGCREAAILRQYKVAASPSGVLVTVQHAPAPFTLTLGSDGRLTGSGTVRVDGRQFSNVTQDGRVTYLPRSASCAVGVLAPAKGGAGS